MKVADSLWKWTMIASSLVIVGLLATAADKQDAKAKKKKAAATTAESLPSPVAQRWQLADTTTHRDFPSLAFDPQGVAWLAYLEHDGQADILRLARKSANAIENVAQLSTPGVVHQPSLISDASGGLWCFWGQVDQRDIVTLRARRFAAGQLEAEQTLAASEGSDTFADAGCDHLGNVWVTWQSMRRGQGDIFARRWDAKSGQWTNPVQVSKPAGGNWEPRLALDGRDGAWIVFDSSRGGDFNLYLAHVGLDGAVKEQPLTSTPEYEARARVAVSPDKARLWIAAERGRPQWGMEQRGHEGPTGMNGQKRILLGSVDLATGKFTEVPVPAEDPRPSTALNLPVVAVDSGGNPVVARRYFHQNRWLIAVARYDTRKQQWSESMEVPDSAFGQDRQSSFLRDAAGKLWLAWAADRRETKMVQTAGIYLAEIAPSALLQPSLPGKVAMLPPPQAYATAPAPDRPRDEHRTWNFGGKKYTLVFGDVHRHTDFSRCRTEFDGCALEHYRYAYDMAGLDFMGTSDHTDAAKKYDPYEWWQTQRMADVFYTPGKFNSLYAYEREQSYPWGHRNIVFAQRGGPIIYMNRKLYQASQWNALYPARPGDLQINPPELWEILGKYGKPVAAISHTGATGMGTDWDKYPTIDYAIENVIEIYQGARVSYEGKGAPQPTIGLRQNQKYTADTASEAKIPAAPAPIEDFGQQRNNGLYQHALAKGHKLGVFASSDHISQHCSFGGVYVEENTRQGIIEGLKARRTIAATDKIFLELSCNGQPMGAIFAADRNPELTFAVNGTAPVKRLTIVRNEENYKVFEPGKNTFESSFTDPTPLAGENRYYLRVEQTDGSMAWSSPVWVTVKK
jgi:hypothetical protein